MRRFKIVNAEPLPKEELVRWRRYLPFGFKLSAPSSWEKEELKELLADADFLMVSRREIDREIIQAGRKLRLIQCLRSYVQNIDVKAAEAAGVPVATLRLIHWPAVAEHTILLVLALAKHLLHAHALVTSGYNPKSLKPQQLAYNWVELKGITCLFGKTLGIVGLGRIGREVAKRAHTFEMKILYHQRHRLTEKEEGALGVTYANLDELLLKSDFVSLHVPHTFQTERIIGERELGLMKPTAFFINTSRGNVVDEVALYKVLKEKRIAGAGLDVFSEEPLPSSSPLLTLDNVVLTPHVASGFDSIEASMDYYYPKYFENIIRVARGKQPSREAEP